jgi:hypothetical protein|tara:strand:- start:233 stop:517 length:285 start_codon:yes stop_codon:yes gene_type:complete
MRQYSGLDVDVKDATEKQQARHDIDVCKASLRAVIKQVSSIKGAYQHPMDSRVNCYLLSALNELTKIYDEDWTQYINTETFINAKAFMESIKEK